MPRKQQSPRWETRNYADRRLFHGYTDFGIKMIDHGFMLRITRPELFKDNKFMNEHGHYAIYDPYTNDLEKDIINSCLTDEAVENLLWNLKNRSKDV